MSPIRSFMSTLRAEIGDYAMLARHIQRLRHIIRDILRRLRLRPLGRKPIAPSITMTWLVAWPACFIFDTFPISYKTMGVGGVFLLLP